MPRPRGQTRERMLDAAEDLFQRFGYGGVAVEDVTDAVGVRKPDLYNHFRDKAELYTAARRRALDRLGAALRSAMGQERSSRKALPGVVEVLLRNHAWLDALRAHDAEAFLPAETRDFLFAHSYAVLYLPVTDLLRSGGASAADAPFLFNTLVALAGHFGRITPDPDIHEIAERIAALLG